MLWIQSRKDALRRLKSNRSSPNGGRAKTNHPKRRRCKSQNSEKQSTRGMARSCHSTAYCMCKGANVQDWFLNPRISIKKKKEKESYKAKGLQQAVLKERASEGKLFSAKTGATVQQSSMKAKSYTKKEAPL
ncbi:Homeobox domain-containing protein [Sesbania bispinosa]|nr:Homeobox domain-containing protein [Sesbania bispinosa]